MFDLNKLPQEDVDCILFTGDNDLSENLYELFEIIFF